MEGIIGRGCFHMRKKLRTRYFLCISKNLQGQGEMLSFFPEGIGKWHPRDYIPIPFTDNQDVFAKENLYRFFNIDSFFPGLRRYSPGRLTSLKLTASR
jgi:hypothetical protein